MKKVVGALLAGVGVGAAGAVGVAGAVAIIIITILLKPLFALLVGWVIGFGLKLIAGSFVAGALSAIFHTAIAASALPQIFAGIALLASFIKPSHSVADEHANKEKVKTSFEDLKTGLRDSR